MRRVGYLALMAMGLSSVLSCGSDPPPCTNERCCVSGSTPMRKCGSCDVGEVSVPLVRCESMDAAAGTCGDGKFTPNSEQCDLTASGAGCGANEMCDACQCVPVAGDVCGDGQVTGAEGCEANRDCTTSPDLVCRRCLCAFKSERVTFDDTPGDIPMTPQGFGLTSVGLELDGGATDVVVFTITDVNGVQADKLSEACFVVITAGGPEQRLCYQKAPGMPREASFTGEDGQKRVLMASEASVRVVGGGGFLVEFSTTLGLRTEPALNFYFETRYDGMRTDVLPDSGVISFKEIFGE